MRTSPGLLCTFITICFAATASFSATFPGSGLGQIPDSPAGGNLCGDFSGPPLNVTFAVSGLTAPLSDVRVGFTSSGLAHSWVGDLTVTLRAPSDAAVKTIFGGTGAVLATDCGDNSDVAGPYNFFDSAPASPTWWQAATTAGAAVPVAAGDYQATVPAPGGGANTPITPTFAGLTTGQINGTWTLRFHDGGQGDTGAISAAALTFTSAVSPLVQHVVDMDGDGKTDWCVVRNYEAPSPFGRIIWITRHNAGTDQIDKLGIATDFFLPADYDGDGKTDVAVWRPGAPGVAAWYILQSGSMSTLRSETFGQSGDDPSVVGDYDADGKDDLAVYRPGALSGDPSFWYWRQTNNGVLFNRQWGQQGDFPAPGDYDGDGKNDFSVQRNDGSGARFWTLTALGTTSTTRFGNIADLIVPGDYDGDNKTDIAVARGVGPDLIWFILPSNGGPYTQTVFGLAASDYIVQGDYDGDGKTDIAVWRPGAPDPTYFYVNKSTGGLLTFEWGLGPNPIVGDYPAANYNVH